MLYWQPELPSLRCGAAAVDLRACGTEAINRAMVGQQIGRLAQLVERLLYTQDVGGSKSVTAHQRFAFETCESARRELPNVA